MQQDIRSAHELMTLIEHEQSLIVSRLRSDDIEGIHEFVMEHALKSRKYYMELIVLMGKEQARHLIQDILHSVYGDTKSYSQARTSGLHNDDDL